MLGLLQRAAQLASTTLVYYAAFLCYYVGQQSIKSCPLLKGVTRCGRRFLRAYPAGTSGIHMLRPPHWCLQETSLLRCICTAWQSSCCCGMNHTTGKHISRDVKQLSSSSNSFCLLLQH